MTDLLYGLDAAERERVAALRAEGRFFWLDVSLSETSRGDLVDALGIPERAQALCGGLATAPPHGPSTLTESPSSSRCAAMSSSSRRRSRTDTACGQSRFMSSLRATTC